MNTISLVIDHKFLVDARWVDTCLGQYSDKLFSRSCIGYWARGVAFKESNYKSKEKWHAAKWLIWESTEKATKHGDEPGKEEAMRRLHEGGTSKPGPKLHNEFLQNWHIIDLAIVKKAWLEGLKLKGEKWFDFADGSFYDVVLQRALFGEVRYG